MVSHNDGLVIFLRFVRTLKVSRFDAVHICQSCLDILVHMYYPGNQNDTILTNQQVTSCRVFNKGKRDST